MSTEKNKKQEHKTVILDAYGVNPGDLSWDFLDKYGEKIVYDRSTNDNAAERVGDADIILTNRIKIGGGLLDKCPNVRFVSALGTGFDMIDVSECRKRSVEVCNVPGYSTSSVAQHAFSLLLALVSDIPGWHAAVRDGLWTGTFDYSGMHFTELNGKTVGIYGCGTIGTKMAEICGAFGMNVIGYRRNPPKINGKIHFVGREELLSRSDFISLHCPLSDETRGLVDRVFISKMKDGAYLINTSRGAVINENDLYDALVSGKLAGAALDVMSQEPPDVSNPLLKCEKCIITPHCAWTSREARLRLLETIDRNISSFIETGKGINRVL